MKCAIITLFLLISTSGKEWKGFTSSNNLFASSLYREILKHDKGNFLVSPFSAEIVLAFVQSGARNETAKELQAALHLPQDREKIQASIKGLLPLLTKSQQYSLHVADKMYVREGYRLKDAFTKVATEVFGSETASIDFGQTVKAAKTMNRWVEEHTGNKIHDLIDPDLLDRNAKAVLINAVHFQSNWRQPFDMSFTQEKDFHSGREVLKVATMYMVNGLFNYRENLELKAHFLEMPFEDSNASMVFVLPNERNGLPALERKIDRVLLPQKLEQVFIHVSLPKFKIESKFDFKEVLKNLGVVRAFDEEKADLSGISEDKLHISKVAQKCFIDVNEVGVEAAAASYDVMSPRIYALLNFDANHPFIFYVKVKEVIVFVGRVITPSYET